MISIKKRISLLILTALLLCSAVFVSVLNVNADDSWDDWSGTGGTIAGSGQIRIDYNDSKIDVTTGLTVGSTSSQRIRSIGWRVVINTNDGRTASAVLEYAGDDADYSYLGNVYSGYMFTIDYIVNEFKDDAGSTGEAVAKQFFYGTGAGGGGKIFFYAYFTKWIEGRYDAGYEIGGYSDGSAGSISGKYAGDPVNSPTAPINYTPANVKFDVNPDSAFGGLGVASTEAEAERIPASWGGSLDLNDYYPAVGSKTASPIANNDITISIEDMGQFHTDTDVIQTVLVTNNGLADITPTDNVKVSFNAKQFPDTTSKSYQSSTQTYSTEPAASKTYTDGNYTGTVYWQGTETTQVKSAQTWNSRKYHDSERTDTYSLSDSSSHSPSVLDYPNTYRNGYLGDYKTQWVCLGYVSYLWHYITIPNVGAFQYYVPEYYTFPDGTSALISTDGNYIIDKIWTFDGYKGGYDTTNTSQKVWTGYYSGMLYDNKTTTVTNQTKTVICPAQSSQIVYFKYHTSKTAGNVTETATVNGNKAILETDTDNDTASKTISVTDLTEKTPPDPKATDKPDYYFKYIDPQSMGITQTRTWGLYEWVNNDFKYVTYSATTSSSLTVKPDSHDPTAEKSGSTYTMKSGYGVTENLNTSVKTTSTDSSAITGQQRSFSYYPEFEYNRSDIDKPNSGFFRIMEEMTTGLTANFQLAENKYSHYQSRVQYTPVWFHDGTYTVETYSFDAWTPSGMISSQAAGSVNIKGSLFDDYEVLPVKAWN